MQNQDSMMDVFIYESQQLLEALEEVLLEGEKSRTLNEEQINEVFRIMHTIKGSSAMMELDGLAKLSHALEDMFAQIRERKARSGDWGDLFDIVLSAGDAIKGEILKLQGGHAADGEFTPLIAKIHKYLDLISMRKVEEPSESSGMEVIEGEGDAGDDSVPFYKIKVVFEPDCQMENMRAFGVVNMLQGHCQRMAHIPGDLMAEAASAEIAKNGLIIYAQTAENPDELKPLLEETMFLHSSSVLLLPEDSEELPVQFRKKKEEEKGVEAVKQTTETIAKQNFISVNVNKLDSLMDLVGEIVTTESMVTTNPEIAQLRIEGFERNAQQLKKLINDLQDTVMSIRMIPVSTTFHKMHRIVRDVAKKVSKEIELVLIGEETEVDKNIIDTLSDPLMHLIRNSVDHGIEKPADRVANGKSPVGRVTLEARNAGGDVIILVSDDGAGLDKSAIIRKAIERGLTSKAEQDISDKEAFSFIFLPGFSTNEQVTEFSGRGVGMDVVRRNIDKVGGSIQVDSAAGEGTTTTIRIPLTLAIIDGMKLRVGKQIFIVPLLTIQESFKPDMKNVFLDPGGQEMITIREQHYPIVRLYDVFGINHEMTNLSDGILIMIRTDSDAYCLFVDELIGEQQVVVKPLPTYIQKHNIGMHGIGGCAILGDGSICLIIDINNLIL